MKGLVLSMVMIIVVAATSSIITRASRPVGFTPAPASASATASDWASDPPSCPRFTAALAFGDSTTDTGNDIIQDPAVFNNSAHLPYGETYFGRATGRYSDGRLMVDYLMAALGQPLLEPYLAINPQALNKTMNALSPSQSQSQSQSQSPSNSDDDDDDDGDDDDGDDGAPLVSLKHGDGAQRGNASRAQYQNFAFSGATALGEEALAGLAGDRLRHAVFTPIDLGDELRWFDDALRRQRIDAAGALVYLGEMGGNDYNYAIGAGDDATGVVLARLVRPVVSRLRHAIAHVLGRGVRRVLVQGQFPQGCLSLYLALFNATTNATTTPPTTTTTNATTTNATAAASAAAAAGTGPYDEHGCIAAVNAVSSRHNALLRAELDDAARGFPDAELLFLDTYAAYLHVLANAAAFNITDTTDACDPRDALRFSGPAAALLAPRVSSRPPCPNPQNFLSWDSIHMTDATYGILSRLFVADGRFVSHYPNFLSRCAAAAAAPSA